MSASFNEWKQFAVPVMAKGAIKETTMEDAMLDFFYSGVDPWISEAGYHWSIHRNLAAKKFVYFCYVMYTTLESGDGYTMNAPVPKHRDLPEDFDTFNIFADLSSFSDMLLEWRDRDEIVGTRLDYMIRDFCYVWIDVERGPPNAWTQTTIEMNDEGYSDDEAPSGQAEGAWSNNVYLTS
jgi:hypothetical protein